MAVGLFLDGVADRRDGHFGMDLVDALVAVADAVELADARAQRWGEFFAAARHCCVMLLMSVLRSKVGDGRWGML